MGRGRKPIPTAIKLARGNPSKRPINDLEPLPARRAPECPIELTGHAGAAWDQLTRTLEGMGVLTIADGNALARYCVLWARWRACEEYLAEYGMFRETDGGSVRVPHAIEARQLAEQLIRIECEFGLTPSSRTKIRVERVAKEETLEGFLRISDVG